ncbi:MAG: DHH family phosphoesterase [Spirochaetales bacterium]|nr:DHH family phosphoesterase [Spirochaetales bacterium]
MAKKIETLVSILKNAPGKVFIQTHDVPDPDAIASAFALRQLLSELGVDSRIVYDREFNKIDSRRMVELLGIELSLAADVASMDAEDWIVIVDGQQGNANIVDLGCVGVAVIDHHELRKTSSYRFADIRPELGSCSSIIADYYFDAGTTPSQLVATGLLYGLFVDTDNLTRGVSELDATMFCRLRPLADAELIRRLRGSQLTRADLNTYANAFRTVEVYDRLAFIRLDNADDSLVGSANDLILSLDEVDASVAFSVRDDGVRLSVRSLDQGIRANELASALVEGLGFGGGHAHMAGGFVPVDRLPGGKSVDTLFRHRAISYLESSGY